MRKIVISVFLLTYAWSTLAGAVEAFSHQGEDQHVAHEFHDIAHELTSDSASGDEESQNEHLHDNGHHHCVHNLVGMASSTPAAHRADISTPVLASNPNLYHFELQQRLLRPPRD